MNIPSEVVQEVEGRFGSFQALAEVGGGCIHPGRRIRTQHGDRFLKFGRGTAPGFFAAEAEGLRQLAAAAPTLKIPEVQGFSDAADGWGFGWIMMEWLEPGRRGEGFPALLAEGLSQLHAPAPGGWGWERSGFIGTLPQDNGAEESWGAFWRNRRLKPQLQRVRERGRLPLGERQWSQLLDRLPELLAAGDGDGPSLLHGDLWGGNILAISDGRPALVDPAVYRGHREVDLAMSELFGGLDPAFYERYEAIRPLEPGYREIRRGIYQLYYLLVHVNLFGDGYVAPTAATLQSVLARI